MKKKILLFAILTLFLMAVIPDVSFAAGSGSRVVDSAGLLTESQRNDLSNKLDNISSKYGVDVVIYTDTTLSGKTPQACADDFYDAGGYAADGIVFMLNMEDRDWAISTKGFGITAFTDAGQEYIFENIKSYLSDDKYYKAFDKFADYADDFIKHAKDGKPYDKGNLPKKPFALVKDAIIAILAGLGVGGLRAGSLKSETQTLKKANKASSYLQGNVMLTAQNEVFRGSRMAPVQRSGDGGGSSTHVSSSGETHGGSSGKF